MKINKDVAFSCIYPGVVFACAFIGCAVLAVEWLRHGQWLRGALLVYGVCIPTGFALYLMWKEITKDRHG